MTKSKYLTLLLVFLGVIMTAFGLLHYLHLLMLPMPLFQLIIFLVPFLAAVGIVIVVPGFSKPAEQFVMRFMILTTVQMLTVLSVIAAVWYTNKIHLKEFGLQFISAFIALLAVQSVLLILVNNKKG